MLRFSSKGLKRLVSAWPLAVAALSCIYALYLVGAITSSQKELIRANQARILSDGARRAATIANFFSDRKNELADIAERSEIEFYLANKDLGMSDRYGLIANLAAIDEYFSRKLGRVRGGGFERLALYDEKQALLASAPLQAVGPAFVLSDFTSRVFIDAPAGIYGFVAPVLHKERVRGAVLATGRIDSFRGFLLSERQDDAYRELLLDGSGRLLEGNSAVSPLPEKFLGQLVKIPSGRIVPVAALNLDEDAAKEFLVLRNEVSGTPLSLLTVMRRDEVFGGFHSASVTFLISKSSSFPKTAFEIDLSIASMRAATF